MKRIISAALAVMLVFVLCFTAFAVPDSSGKRVNDLADLLSDYEEMALTTKINQIFLEYNYEVHILTVDSTDGSDIQTFADDYYDINGLGYGDNNDGMVFVIAMDTREYWTSTTGVGIDVFNDAVIDYLGDRVVYYLKNGDYYGAFDAYVGEVQQYLYEYENGITGENYEEYYSQYYSDYAVDNSPSVMDYAKREIILVVVALVIGLIVVSSMKKKMNTAVKQTRAANYLKKDSFKITQGKEVFLYDRVTKVKKPEDDDNSRSSGGFSSSRPSGGGGFSGGSSTHTSSSGVSHGGGGGRF